MLFILRTAVMFKKEKKIQLYSHYKHEWYEQLENKKSCHQKRLQKQSDNSSRVIDLKYKTIMYYQSCILLTLKTVMNRYTDEISKLAILAKFPVPKKATLNRTI